MIINNFILYFSQLALSLIHKIEDRLRLGIKNKRVYFVFLSTCTIFMRIMKNIHLKYLRINTILFICLLLCASCKKMVQKETEDESDVYSEWTDSQGHLYEYSICVDSFNVTKNIIKNGDNLSAIDRKSTRLNSSH